MNSKTTSRNVPATGLKVKTQVKLMTQRRRIVWFMTLVIGLVLVEVGARNADASPQDQGQNQDRGQQQPGTFPVGHATRLLNVLGIHDVNSPEIRSVNVHFWYPARDPQDCQSGDGNSQGCPPSVYTSRLNGIPLLPQWDPLSWTIGTRQSFEELPLSDAQSSYPVIIFSHGTQGNAIDYVYALEALASYGYIVAAPDHVNNTQDDVRIDFINAQANSTVIPCFDGLATPCEVTSRVKAEHSNIDPAVFCPPGSLIAMTTASIRESMTDRVRDVSAIIDALPTWFGSRADTSRIGMMGHSRGTATSLAAAGGSACWGFPAEPRVKAIMGLAIALVPITFGANIQDITVPALLVAGTDDTTSPPAISQAAFDMLASMDKHFVPIENAKHRHFDSGLCAQTQSSGAIAAASPRAILDLRTFDTLVRPSFNPSSGVPMDFCGYDTFTMPSDITNLVFSLTGFSVTPTNVPTTGLDSNQVKNQVVGLARDFFGRVL
jgi:predicted dienelactone hydrolase